MKRYFQEHIDRLVAYSPGEQIDAAGLIKLNTNENPYPPSPRVTRALASLDPEKLRKYPQPLADDFRAAAAKVLAVPPECILAGNGSDDLLRMIAMAFIGPGQAAAAPYPTYTLYEVLAAIQNGRMHWVDWPDDYSLPIDALAAAKAPVTFLANPNAPTGTLVAPARIAELAGRLDGVLVVDEAYVDFALADSGTPGAPSPPPPSPKGRGGKEDGAGSATCLPRVAGHDNLIVLRTFSKGYSLAGLRFGYAVACRELIAGLSKVKDSYNCDAVSIALATAAIRDQDYVRATAAKVVAERGRLVGLLRDREWYVLDSRANFVLARPPDGQARRRYEALKQRNILVRYFDQRRLDDRVRITVGTPRQTDALIAALDEIGQGQF